MDSLIKVYDEEFANLKKGSTNQSGDSVYIIHPLSLSNQKEEDNSALNFSNLPVDKMIHVINANDSLRKNYFSNGLYSNLSQEDFKKVLTQVEVPYEYIKKVINHISSLKKNKDSAIMTFLNKNIEAITEDIVLKLIKNYHNDNVYKFLIEKVSIDIDYLMQLIKDDNSLELDSTEVQLLCDTLVESKQNEFGWVDFLKDILTIAFLKKVIKESYFTKTMKAIEEKENNREEKTYNEKEMKEEFDIELINKISNNSASIIAEKIVI